MKNVSFAVLGILLSGCACGPAEWAEKAEARLECGMSVEDVRNIAGRDIQHMDVPRDWTTDLIRDGSTDLWLGFQDGKLTSVQVLWAQKMMKMAMYQRRDLCAK
jgi:hypothetical protein